MKRIIALLLIVVMCLTLFAGCGKKNSKSDSGKVFILGFDAEYPPYGYMDDNGEYIGFDIDLATEACKRLGWELKLQPINWDSKDAELESGNIDCIWNGFTKSEERLNLYAWTDAYVNNSIVFLVLADSGYDTKADLAGKTIDVQAASSAADALYSEDEADFYASLGKVVEVKDYNTAVMDLEAGAVDAIAIDIGVAKFQVADRDNLKIMSETLIDEQYGIGFRTSDTEMRDTIQKTLYDMVKDGTFMEIAKKWELQDAVCLGE